MTTDTEDKAARAVQQAIDDALAQYDVQGTTDNEWGGPLYRAPWHLIDVSRAEPEVDWPGDLVGEFDQPIPAYREKSKLVAQAAIAAYRAHLESEGLVVVSREPTAMMLGNGEGLCDLVMPDGFENTACERREELTMAWQAMIRAWEQE